MHTTRITLDYLRKSACAKYNAALFEDAGKEVKRAKEEPAGLKAMEAVLIKLGIPYIKEHRFHPERKWRFDIAILYLKCGVEYEGLMSAKSRHTTKTGYTGDTEKYSQAAILGWKVLRYTAMNFERLERDLLAILAA